MKAASVSVHKPDSIGVSIAELADRYEDDDDYSVEERSAHDSSAVKELTGEDVAVVKEEGKEDYEEWEEDEDEEDDEQEVLEALDWWDMHEESSSAHAFVPGAAGPNAGGGSGGPRVSGQRTYQPRSNQQLKLDAKISTKPMSLRYDAVAVDHGQRLPASVANAVRSSVMKEDDKRIRLVDKSDRATLEQALDPRTRMVLFKMLNKGVFHEINGCVSTGKEANVYHAVGEGEDGSTRELAVKVFKTSILVFKDRERYVQGDYRFRHGYSKHNPRKMVKTWAEKELRNLQRLHQAGIPCPQPLLLRLHILVMTFLGHDGWAAPRLKDAELPPSKWQSLYTECVLILRKMYQKCRLVHGDFSEYNILYYKGSVFVIDVSQAVELDHPRALDFLREDCLHVRDFFQKKGVLAPGVRAMFDFITDTTITDENVDECLQRMQEQAAAEPEDTVADAVFHQAFIPKKMDEVVTYERDAQRLQSGQNTEGIYYQTIMGMKPDLSGPRDGEQAAAVDAGQEAARGGGGDSSSSDSDGEGTEEDSDSSGEEGEGEKREWVEHRDRKPLSKEEIREQRRQHKKQVKAEKSEARKKKLPKALKKKKLKQAKEKAKH
eukprot:jgi/Mesvir1/5988/Mv00739-RA.1